ncbi:hypothetical protein EV284_6405 [Streptomyces sp. BK022]|uniref:hypothetical protein n=1 Tax=Streptomyces sp. BK022 TaxID=2512123 RepID=UPI0010288410|nr:hypothetical protein [Streptomyces sp. BK022]RZU28239.1 hypothetical protein EV284_6405 [Streptomyces sp. BK022]
MSTAPSVFTLPDILAALHAGVELTADESGLDFLDGRFTWPYAATLARLDNPDTTWSQVSDRHDKLRQLWSAGTDLPDTDDDARTYTREQVSTAVNWAVDEAADINHLGGCADDVDNFLVNAVLTLLDDPDAAFTDVVDECYGEDPDLVSRWLHDAA